MGQVGSYIGSEAVALRQRSGNLRLGQRAEVDAQGAALDRGEHTLGIVAHHQDNRFRRRLFNELQQFVGARLVHALRHPKDDDTASALTGAEAELADELVRLSSIKLTLLILGTRSVHPFTQFKVGVGKQSLAPVEDEVIALRIGVGIAPAFPLEHGHHEVHVGMYQLVHLHAGWAMPARIGWNFRIVCFFRFLLIIRSLWEIKEPTTEHVSPQPYFLGYASLWTRGLIDLVAHQIASKGNGHRQLARTHRPGKQLCMRDTPALQLMPQLRLHLFLPDYILEKHNAQSQKISLATSRTLGVAPRT